MKVIETGFEVVDLEEFREAEGVRKMVKNADSDGVREGV